MTNFYTSLLKDLAKQDLSDPSVLLLVEFCRQLQEENQLLKDEIARLKNNNPRPKLKPSRLDDENPPSSAGSKPKIAKKRSPRKKKVSKRITLKNDEVQIIKAKNVPDGSRFKGHENYHVQELIISPWVVLYKRERWQTPDGKTIVAPLPESVKASHFGPTLRSFVLHQYYNCGVTQNLIAETLVEKGIQISEGSISNLLTLGHDALHAEKEGILVAGLRSPHIHTDDTGARHKGKNGYCTHIGNPLFTWFKTTFSKSRINFLEILRGSNEDYVLNAEAFEYARKQKLPKSVLKILKSEKSISVFPDKKAFEQFLDQADIKSLHHRRIITEAALTGSISSRDGMKNTTIISDDAGQFNVFNHALCWVHAVRNLTKLHSVSEKHDQELDRVHDQVWAFYRQLKAYQKEPSPEEKIKIEADFDAIFKQSSFFALLQQALHRIAANKSELLRVLDDPKLPLHNNLSERDIREFVKRRKLGGTTRSESGKKCLDTFLSIKKTCRKWKVSFWDFLNDRIRSEYIIPLLPTLIENHLLACNEE